MFDVNIFVYEALACYFQKKKKKGILIMILLHLIRTLRLKKIVMCPFPRQDASQPVKLKQKL